MVKYGQLRYEVEVKVHIFLLVIFFFCINCNAADCTLPNNSTAFSSRILSSADRIQALPGYGCLQDVELSGYLPIKPTVKDNTGLFYWFIESRSHQKNAPLVLWLNGGPGATSLYGLFMENGPYIALNNKTLKSRKYAWSNEAHYLVIDQPAGVGFSFGKKGAFKTEAEAMDQLLYALRAFFNRYPELANNQFYIAGESYAGKYIPQLAMRIIVSNQTQQAPHIQLKGIIIGDGWVDPKLQQSTDADFAYSHGLIDPAAYLEIKRYYEQCALAIDSHTPSSRLANHLCMKMQEYIQTKAGKINLANIRQAKEESDEAMVSYLNQGLVKNALHIKSPGFFSTFSEDVAHALEIGEQDSVAPLYAKILGNKIRVLVYNGLDDAKDSNFMGTDKWLAALEWPYHKDFNQAPSCIWQDHNQVLGYVKTSHLLTQVKIRNAGHLAPIDQPEVLFRLFNQFINNQNLCA